jgi:hypothetical protein
MEIIYVKKDILEHYVNLVIIMGTFIMEIDILIQ